MWFGRAKGQGGATGGQGTAQLAAGRTAGADSVEDMTQRIGRELLERARGVKSGGVLGDRLVGWALKDAGFRNQLLRFIDVFPMLRTPAEVHAHLEEYLSGARLPTGAGWALAAGGLMKGAMTAALASQIEGLARTFIAGRDAAEAVGGLRKLWDAGRSFSVDLLGEACLADSEAAAYQRRYLDLLAFLPGAVAEWPTKPALESDHLGPIPRVNVSVKISSLYARTKPAAWEASLDGLMAALEPLVHLARQKQVFINFDMENHDLKDLTLALFARCCARWDFPAGIAVQAYLRSVDADVERLLALARRTGRRFTVRLIKGAYWDYEVARAAQQNWPCPVWPHKADTDAAFERATAQLVQQIPRQAGEAGITLALGSHNVRSIAHALALVRARNLPDSALEMQMLRGMAEGPQQAVVASGLRLRQYMPVGELVPGMAYLVRRLLENTSNQSWLRAAWEEADADTLLAAPVAGETRNTKPETRNQGTAAFTNEPLRDFADGPQREAFAVAVQAAQVPAVPGETSLAELDGAMARAAAAFPAWRERAVTERAQIIRRAAELLRERRDELAGVMVHEAAKPWAEADADVCEAIDFCEFYAQAAEDLQLPRALSALAMETNHLVHEGRGVAAVIAPWNFPLSILTGLTAAALVTGNTVLLKPAEQTPAIARCLYEILREAGVPDDVVHFVPGPGETVGAALVRDPRVATIAFTGSKDVGLEILRAAHVPDPRRPFIKRVVAELGGKNALIVDASADLDEAVAGVRHSAFSYAGQKCSACSRCIVVDAVWNAFVPRLLAATQTLVAGPAADPATDVPPVIDAAAARRIWEYIRIGKEEGELVWPTINEPQINTNEHEGEKERLIQPHIFTGIRPEHRLAREEIFGPVLAVLRVKDFAAALDLANASAYKLTGGLYSRTPSHLRLARQQFRVGNLYLNRPITGALVARQPFGGFGLSGTNTKAGGRAYLLHFVEPRVLTENTLRHGFVPENDAAD